MYLCIRVSIVIGYWNCSDSAVFLVFVFHFNAILESVCIGTMTKNRTAISLTCVRLKQM